MKKLLLLLIIPFLSFGQGWEQTFGGLGWDEGRSVQQTNDGGYIITGFKSNNKDEEPHVYLVKTDANGNEQWSQTFGGIEVDASNEYYGIGAQVQQTIDGGYAIGGTSAWDGSGTEDDALLIKTDANGNEQWSQTFGGIDSDFINSIQQTNDGGYIMTGGTDSFGNGGVDVYLIKTDANGNEQWSQTFGGIEVDEGRSVQQTNDGGYIMSGLTSSFGNGSLDVYVIKTDENGTEEWSQTFGGVEKDVGRSIQATNDGGYIVCGNTRSFGNGDYDSYLIKINENGTEEWSQTFGGTSEEHSYSVQQTNDGGYIMAGCGYIMGGNGALDVYVIKTDENGTEEWSQAFGGAEYDWGRSIQQTNDGGYIICGQTVSFGQIFPDIYLIKTDSDGNVTSTNIIETPAIKKNLITTIDILGRESTDKGFQLHIYDDGSVEKKYLIK